MKQEKKTINKEAPRSVDDIFTAEEGLRYVVIEPDGQTIAKKTNNDDTLTVFQDEVGGNIEYVHCMRDGIAFYINEEGKNFNLPYNHLASIMAAETIMPGDYIAGPMIMVGLDERGRDCSLPLDVVKAICGDS
jgi:hypothetical protein